MAQSGVNKVILVGRLGQDPEVRFMPNGGAVANLSVATSESWKDKQSGEPRESTEWHRVTLYGKLAEVAGEYLKKGSQAYFEGQLKTRKWQDQQGQDRYTTEIVVQGYSGVMQMLGDARGGGQNQSTAQQQPQQQWQGQQQAPQQQAPHGWQQNQAQQQPPQQQAQPQNQQQQMQQQSPQPNQQVCQKCGGTDPNCDVCGIPFNQAP